jgi:hypothetical protein
LVAKNLAGNCFLHKFEIEEKGLSDLKISLFCFFSLLMINKILFLEGVIITECIQDIITKNHFGKR